MSERELQEAGRMSLPENLYLYVDVDAGELSIRDAQDIIWVLFRRGGNGDPIEWATNVVLGTCKGLGVTEAWATTGEELDLADAIDRWIMRVPGGVVDGFLP